MTVSTIKLIDRLLHDEADRTKANMEALATTGGVKYEDKCFKGRECSEEYVAARKEWLAVCNAVDEFESWNC